MMSLMGHVICTGRPLELMYGDIVYPSEGLHIGRWELGVFQLKLPGSAKVWGPGH